VKLFILSLNTIFSHINEQLYQQNFSVSYMHRSPPPEYHVTAEYHVHALFISVVEDNGDLLFKTENTAVASLILCTRMQFKRKVRFGRVSCFVSNLSRISRAASIH